MATDVMATGADEGGDRSRQTPERPTVDASRGGGFFHVYKSGQGYWTRVGSAAAATLITLLTLQFLYTHLNVWLTPAFTPKGADSVQIAHAISMAKGVTLAICGVFLVGMFVLVFWLLNKPDYADFLIATDSEMKKVNWTSRKELIGSTKVVIIFMFLIAFLLFAFDFMFGELFYMMGVLKLRPMEGIPLSVRVIFWLIMGGGAAAIIASFLRTRNERLGH
ncbi:MAG TPA: preprotein translocase subunit SecE [Tepidisphaeraceae bacterium]